MKKKVFVSFDYENDRYYKYLLQAWDANPDFDFEFYDMSSGEIKTDDISRVKAALSAKIAQADYTLVIIGKEANKQHKDSYYIGYRNWQNYEIARSKAYGNRLVAVKLDYQYGSPEELLGSGASWAYSFNRDSILRALNNA